MLTIQELISQADEAHIEELIQERAAKEPVSLEFLIRNFPAWKRWYLKRNQQRNYFRITRIVPPGMEQRPFFWQQTFQVWIKDKIDQEYPIDAHTFDYWAMQPGWEKKEEPGITKAIFRPDPPKIHHPAPGNDY